MRKPLKSCANGCDKPPKPPSLVLCEDCFAKLSKKIHDMLDLFKPPEPKP